MEASQRKGLLPAGEEGLTMEERRRASQTEAVGCRAERGLVRRPGAGIEHRTKRAKITLAKSRSQMIMGLDSCAREFGLYLLC